MNFADIDKCECSNGLGVGVSLFVQGCHFHCKNCFNPETWDFNGGKQFTEETTKTILRLIEPDYISRFSILGGEPLNDKNIWGVADLVKKINSIYPEKKIWVYTGYTYENLREKADKDDFFAMPFYAILTFADVLVDGPFIEKEKDITLQFKGSSNQRIIDLNKTREQIKPVLLKI